MRGVVQDSFFGVIVLVATMAPLVAMTAAKKSNSQQLRVKPKASASGLPVPDLLESPDAKYDPKPKDIDIAALQLRLKDHFDGRFMSIGKPKEALLYPNGTAEYPLRYDNNNNVNFKHNRPKWNIGSLQLPDGTKLRSRFARKVRKKMEQFLWMYTQCPVIYRWKDLGSRYWPPWIKQGRCHTNQSCSFPPGMNCVASEERDIVILRWHCQHWDPPRFCKWIFTHYPILTQCQCGCSSVKPSHPGN